MLAAGGWAEEAVAFGQEEVPPSPAVVAPSGGNGNSFAPSDGAASAEGGFAASVSAEGGEMPGMEGYLAKQSGGKAGGSSKGEILKKWDKRYFVIRASQTHLRYYKSKEDFRAGKDPAGTRVEAWLS